MSATKSHDQEGLPFEYFSDYSKISSAIHRRAPFDCGEFARARKIVVAYPSLKDRVRYHALDPAPVPQNESSEAKRARIELQNQELNKLIDVIGCPYVDPSEPTKTDSKKKGRWDDNVAFDNAQELLTEALKKARSCSTKIDFEEIAKCRADLLMADLKGKNEIDGADQSDELFTINDQRSDRKRLRYRWEEFSHNHSLQVVEDAKLDEEVTEDEIRCNFLDFRLDAFTSLSEFWGNPKPSAIGPERQETETSPRKCEQEQCLGTLRCIGRRNKDCGRGKHKADLAKFASQIQHPKQPTSGVLAIADYWVVPAKTFFATDCEVQWEEEAKSFADVFRDKWSKPGDGSPAQSGKATPTSYSADQIIDLLMRFPAMQQRGLTPSNQDKESYDRILAALGEWAADFFRISAELASPLFYEDFVLSYISDGRAILISDLRPDPNLTGVRVDADRQTRTLIIDFGMSPSERGRMLQRLMDIAAFRNLGLRDHPYAQSATDAITRLGISLSELSSTTGQDPAKRLDIVVRLSKALDLLNLFFTYGINGRAASSEGYSLQIERNIELLRESRAGGNQTLAGYLRRYFAAAHDIEVVSYRYNTLRTRINEAATLVKTSFEKEQADKIGQLNRTIVGLTLVSLFIAFVSMALSLLRP